ncbi:hypothetical protein HanXRQr2_Chr16g0769481 [Helianthus annuus]|uniref:Uncharacterized protein n=1 Tax=Helianthus annuus TaxID=4232 RepID=A0A9K3GZS0_HELAN|nr:hypothetical protein HanXRQr2_Chr16g0769481 [Helianthus annuus]KAJ0822911.1 hypothetical protein HanPSC8_Chr16g0737551 [Helianthus annuus]
MRKISTTTEKTRPGRDPATTLLRSAYAWVVHALCGGGTYQNYKKVLRSRGSCPSSIGADQPADVDADLEDHLLFLSWVSSAYKERMRLCPCA